MALALPADPRTSAPERPLRAQLAAARVPSSGTAGPDTVYSGEGDVALAFVEDILESLGAIPEQIDRERARAHPELTAES